MTMKLIFQMACLLHLQCNFLHGYFRCQLPVETVDVEVKVQMMQGIHTFRRDRTSQVIKFNPWSTRLCPYPSLIWKMKTYLELEWKLGPKPRPQPQTQLQPTQPSTNPMVRKAPAPKANDKRKRTMITKRGYKWRVLAQPVPTTTTPTAPVNSPAPTTTVATTSTQMPVTRSTVTCILVMVYKLATGQFAEVPCPTNRPQNEGSNPPLLEDIPSAHPDRVPAAENLFGTRKDWPISPAPVPTPVPTLKIEKPPQVAAIPHAIVMPKQATEKCSWGLYCPIYKDVEEHKEDWDGDTQNQPRMCPKNTQCPQSQTLQCPQMQNTQHTQLQNSQQSFDIPNRYTEWIKQEGMGRKNQKIE